MWTDILVWIHWCMNIEPGTSHAQNGCGGAVVVRCPWRALPLVVPWPTTTAWAAALGSRCWWCSATPHSHAGCEAAARARMR